MSYRQEIVGGYFLLARTVETIAAGCLKPLTGKHWCEKHCALRE